MAEPVTAPASTGETQAEKEARIAREQSQQQAAGSGLDIMGLIMGFLKFLFESFFPGKDAPDEDAGDIGRPAPTAGEIARQGKAIVDSRAIPKWREYQQSHSGETVNFINPVKGGFAPITRDFGVHMHPIHHENRMHTGADLKPTTPGANPDILAAAGGVVLWSGWKNGYGNTVIVGHSNGMYTLYGHLRGDKMPELGANVEQGQTIGVMGKTGGATGEHLHFEERRGSAPIQPQIAGVALTDGVTVPAYNGRPAAPQQASAGHAKPPAAKPHAPAQQTAYEQAAALGNAARLQVAEAYDVASSSISQGMKNARATIGNILG